jgi:hypothetical protein
MGNWPASFLDGLKLVARDGDDLEIIHGLEDWNRTAFSPSTRSDYTHSNFLAAHRHVFPLFLARFRDRPKK